ncbi:MAG: histidine phosphatase family protein [Phycisphaerales bacterium]
MYLYIVRHGKAEDAGSYLRDEDRPLTARGIEQARYLGEQISGGAHAPELIVSSGFSRAVATARVIHQAVRSRFELAASLECDHPVSEAVDLIERCATGGPGKPGITGTTRGARAVRSMMVVGHNPQLGELCTILTQGLAASDVMLRTGEAVCLEVEPGDLIGTGRQVARLRLESAYVGQ